MTNSFSVLGDLVSRRGQLVQARVAEGNRLATVRFKAVGKNVEKHMAWLAKEVARIDEEIDTHVRESPIWRGKRFISGGRGAVRAGLYMAGLTASRRHNPSLRIFYERLIHAGKTAKQALTAVMRKLLTILNAMVRDRIPWQERPNNA
jgi:transposase